jgi:ketosteroid isomerase-like protein
LQPDPDTAREVFAAVDRFLEHLAEGRLEGAMECFAPDADIALYGSEVSEILIGPAALHGLLSKLTEGGGGPRFTLHARTLSARGDVAWFVAESEVAIGTIRIKPYRIAGVLERRDGRWLWMLFSGSEPLPDRP